MLYFYIEKSVVGRAGPAIWSVRFRQARRTIHNVWVVLEEGVFIYESRFVYDGRVYGSAAGRHSGVADGRG